MQDKGTLAGRETWSDQAVVNLASDRESIELWRWNEQTLVIVEAVGSGIRITLNGRDDAVSILVDSGDLCGIGVKEALF